MNLAFVISPLIIGRLIDAGGFDLSFRVSAAIGVVALVLAWAFLPRTAAIVPVPEAVA
jgi:MFS family permease